MTELLLPMTSAPGMDWRSHFNSIRKWFFGMTIVLAMLGIMLSWYITAVPLIHPYRIMQLIILALAIVGWFTPNLTVHRWIAALFIVVLFTGQILFRLFPGLSG